jgi:predicted nicotinamide N-methyase
LLGGLPLVERTIDFAGGPLIITAAMDQTALLAATRDSSLLPLGLMLWESAVALARALDHRAMAGLRVLELGAGVGLCGLLAARAGAQVVQTDIDERALALQRRNASRNGVDGLRHVRLDWHTPDLADVARADLVIGADIVYDRCDHAAIERAVRLALAPKGAVILADPSRSDTPAFLDLLGASGWHMTVTTVTEPDLTYAGRVVEIALIKATREAMT